jgi:hypothetical protein
LGSLLPQDVPWIALVSETEREGISNSIAITLEVIIIPENLPSGLSWKREGVTLVQKHVISGHRFGTQTVSEAEMIILMAFEELARRFAPHLYEIDPRIGFTLNMESFPSSPLFDPQDRKQNPTFCLKMLKQITKLHESPWMDSSIDRVSHPETACVFCKNYVLQDSPDQIVWGGGNVGWVHCGCAPWIRVQRGQILPASSFKRLRF